MSRLTVAWVIDRVIEDKDVNKLFINVYMDQTKALDTLDNQMLLYTIDFLYIYVVYIGLL